MTKELTNSKHSTNSEIKQEKKSKNTITPLLNPSSLTEKNLYNRRAARKRSNTFRSIRSKAVSVQLDEVLRFFKKKSRDRE